MLPDFASGISAGNTIGITSRQWRGDRRARRPRPRGAGAQHMGDTLMATPAIADGTPYVRSRSALFAIARGGGQDRKPARR